MNTEIKPHPDVDHSMPPKPERLPQHLQLAIATRIRVAVDEASPGIDVAADKAPAQRNAITMRAVEDILDQVALYIDGREISMLAALQSASFHVGKVQKMIRDRRP